MELIDVTMCRPGRLDGGAWALSVSRRSPSVVSPGIGVKATVAGGAKACSEVSSTV